MCILCHYRHLLIGVIYPNITKEHLVMVKCRITNPVNSVKILLASLVTILKLRNGSAFRTQATNIQHKHYPLYIASTESNLNVRNPLKKNFRVTSLSEDKIYYQNVPGLRSKTVRCYNEVVNSNYDVIIFTETWLNKGIASSELLHSVQESLRLRYDGR